MPRSRLSLMFWMLLSATAFGASPFDVTVSDLDGKTAAGELLRLDAAGAVLARASGTLEFSPERILEIQIRDDEQPQTAKGPFVEIGLLEGSRLLGTDFTTSGKTAICSLPDGKAMQFPLDRVAWVRFGLEQGSLEKEQPEEWRSLIRSVAAEDRLVVGEAGALDHYTGLLREVTPDSVRFELDGELLPVNRKKVRGVMYRQQPRDFSGTFCLLREKNGSQWVLAELVFDRENRSFQFKTISGIEGAIPFSEVSEISFARKNTVPLLELTPVSVAYTPALLWNDLESSRLTLLRDFLRSKIILGGDSEGKESKAANFVPSLETDSQGEKLPQHPIPPIREIILDGKMYANGYTLHAKTELVFSLEKQYQSLRGIAGIDDRIRPWGNVRLTLKGDETVLFEGNLRGDQPARVFEISLNGCQRLTITVDLPQGINNGARLNLVEATLIK